MPAVAWWMLSFSLLGMLSMEFPSHFDSIALHWRNSFFTGNWKSGCLPGALSHERRMPLMAPSTLLLITREGNVFLCAENRLSGRKLTSYHILSASMSLSATVYCTNPSFLFFFPHWCCALKLPSKTETFLKNPNDLCHWKDPVEKSRFLQPPVYIICLSFHPWWTNKEPISSQERTVY